MADTTKASTPQKTYQQIESVAGYIPPAVYSYLSYQIASWQTSADHLSSQFVPLTSVPRKTASDAKLFIVGLLPPSANVTGRLLDRSATVAAVQGYAEDLDLATGGDIPAGIISAPGYQFPPPTPAKSGQVKLGIGTGAGRVGPDKGPPEIVHHSYGEMYDIFYDGYVAAYGREPTPNELLFLVAQSQAETSGDWPNNNPGFLGPPTKDARPDSFYWAKTPDNPYWNTYQTPQDGAKAFITTVFGNGHNNAQKSAAAGDAFGYTTSLGQRNYYAHESVNKYYAGVRGGLYNAAYAISAAGGPHWNLNLPPNGPDACAFNETNFQYRERVGWTKAALSGKAPPPKWVQEAGYKPGTAAFAASTNRLTDASFYDEACSLTPKEPDPVDASGKPIPFAGQGSEAAAKAAKDADQKADKSLNASQLGQLLMGAQKDYVLRLQQAIKQMEQTPPLRLLVNPTSFKPASEKIISDGNFSRQGAIVEHWGEQQLKLTASGTLAGFYAADKSMGGKGPGITRVARNFSAAYQNFLSLYMIYRNNGTVWLPDYLQQNSKANNLALVGSVYIYYDNVLYIGSFDSFNISESDDKPHSLQYDFSFTVRYAFELDRVPEPYEKYAQTMQQVAPAAAKIPVPTDTSVTQPKLTSAGSKVDPPAPQAPPLDYYEGTGNLALSPLSDGPSSLTLKTK